MGEGEGWGGLGRGQAASTETACAHVWVSMCEYVCGSGNMHMGFLRGGMLLARTELWARPVRMRHRGVPAARLP